MKNLRSKLGLRISLNFKIFWFMDGHDFIDFGIEDRNVKFG